MDTTAKILMLELQNDELFAKLGKEEEAHRKASSRVTATEKQNKNLRAKLEYVEGELNLLEQCWNCSDLGNKQICSKCANSAVFEKCGDTFQWRSYPNNRRR